MRVRIVGLAVAALLLGTAAAQSSAGATRIGVYEGDIEGAASVTEVVNLTASGVKLFSTAGGDPAINGLYTFIAVFTDPQEGWKAFQIGDFDSWKLVSQSPQAVVLDVRRSWVDQASGEVRTRPERLRVTVPSEASTSITVEVVPAA